MTSLSPHVAFGTVPADADPFAVLPRRVWRHLITTGELALRSRIIVAGDAAELAAAFFRSLGFDASPADEQTWDSSPACDAVIWLEIAPTVERMRSLLGVESLQRTSQLLRCVGPRGSFQFVCLTGNDGCAHEVECAESHLKALGEAPEVTVFPTRSFSKLFRGAGRTYAVATCRAERRSGVATSSVFVADSHRDDSCCRWADRLRAA
jgi:hypothetical protein